MNFDLISAETKDDSNERIGYYRGSAAQKSYLLAKKIEARIKEGGFSKQAFAVFMNVQPSIVSRWLSGSHNFTIETLFHIEEKLNIQLVDVRVNSEVNTLRLHLSVSSHATQLNDFKEVVNLLNNTMPRRELRVMLHNSIPNFTQFLMAVTHSSNEKG